MDPDGATRRSSIELAAEVELAAEEEIAAEDEIAAAEEIAAKGEIAARLAPNESMTVLAYQSVKGN